MSKQEVTKATDWMGPCTGQGESSRPQFYKAHVAQTGALSPIIRRGLLSRRRPIQSLTKEIQIRPAKGVSGLGDGRLFTSGPETAAGFIYDR